MKLADVDAEINLTRRKLDALLVLRDVLAGECCDAASGELSARPTPPAPRKRSERGDAREKRLTVARAIMEHGPQSGASLTRLAGLNSQNTFDGLVKDHDWFQRDVDMKWHLTTEGHQAVNGAAED